MKTLIANQIQPQSFNTNDNSQACDPINIGEKMKRFASTLLLIALPFIAGCGVATPFIQPGVNINDSAHLVTQSDHSSKVAGWDRRIYIIAIDDQATHPGIGLAPEEAYLGEGHHKIDIFYNFMGIQAKGHLWLDAQRGHEYVVHREEANNRMRFWLTDGWNGPIVGGISD